LGPGNLTGTKAIQREKSKEQAPKGKNAHSDGGKQEKEWRQEAYSGERFVVHKDENHKGKIKREKNGD